MESVIWLIGQLNSQPKGSANTTRHGVFVFLIFYYDSAADVSEIKFKD